MLNLKELEQKLDNALAKETTESLSNWLAENRIKSNLALLGEGSIQHQKQLQVKFTPLERVGSSDFKVNANNLSNSNVYTANNEPYKTAA
jgi:hypothetical protein